jgi:hypothetical protein
MAAEIGADEEKLWEDVDRQKYIISFFHLFFLSQPSDIVA